MNHNIVILIKHLGWFPSQMKRNTSATMFGSNMIMISEIT